MYLTNHSLVHPSMMLQGGDYPPVHHTQTAVGLNHGWAEVDTGMAPFIVAINEKLPPWMRTDFSCQGYPDKPNSCYVMLSSPRKSCMENLLYLITTNLFGTYPYLFVRDNGEWGAGKHVAAPTNVPNVEFDSIRAELFPPTEQRLRAMYPTQTWRINAKFSPEDLPVFQQAIMRALASL
jgi:hypothetical protein